MRTQKGFVSFILFFLVSLIIISSLQPSITLQSLAPAYASKAAYGAHAHLKRSLKPTALLSLQEAQIFLAAAKSSEDALLTFLGIPPEEADWLTTPIEDNVIRLFVLNGFSRAISDYSKYSSTKNEYYCLPQAPLSTTPPLQLPPALEPARGSKTEAYWVSCAREIGITHNETSIKVSINSGFHLRTTGALNFTMDTKLEPFEVEWYGLT